MRINKRALIPLEVFSTTDKNASLNIKARDKLRSYVLSDSKETYETIETKIAKFLDAREFGKALCLSSLALGRVSKFSETEKNKFREQRANVYGMLLQEYEGKTPEQMSQADRHYSMQLLVNAQKDLTDDNHQAHVELNDVRNQVANLIYQEMTARNDSINERWAEVDSEELAEHSGRNFYDSLRIAKYATNLSIYDLHRVLDEGLTYARFAPSHDKEPNNQIALSEIDRNRIRKIALKYGERALEYIQANPMPEGDFMTLNYLQKKVNQGSEEFHLSPQDVSEARKKWYKASELLSAGNIVEAQELINESITLNPYNIGAFTTALNIRLTEFQELASKAQSDANAQSKLIKLAKDLVVLRERAIEVGGFENEEEFRFNQESLEQNRSLVWTLERRYQQELLSESRQFVNQAISLAPMSLSKRNQLINTALEKALQAYSLDNEDYAATYNLSNVYDGRLRLMMNQVIPFDIRYFKTDFEQSIILGRKALSLFRPSEGLSTEEVAEIQEMLKTRIEELESFWKQQFPGQEI